MKSIGIAFLFCLLFSSQVMAQRPLLTANTTFYSNESTGVDTNSCLSSSTPCTLQGAFKAASKYDLNGFTAKIQGMAGQTNTTGVIVPTFVGSGAIVYDGDGGSILVTDATGIVNYDIVQQALTIQNVKIKSEGSGACITYGSCGWCIATFNVAHFVIGTGVILDGCANAGLGAVAGGSIIQLAPGSNLTFTGGGCWGIEATEGGAIFYSDSAATVYLASNVNFSCGFALAYMLGIIQWPAPNALAPGVAFSGSATGSKYVVGMNGVIYRNGTPFPGSSAGSSSTGGQYLP